MGGQGLSLNELVVMRGGRSVLDGLTLSVPAGHIYALLGGNGAGKSTALFATLGLLPVMSGQVLVDGKDPAEEPDAVRAAIAYLPETVALYEHLTARENVDYFLSLADQSRTNAEIVEAFAQVRLDPTAQGQRLSAFSKGMRQKTAIALALLRKTPVLLLDEPTTGLDPQATQDFHALLLDLKASDVAILMVTHDLLGAVDVADTIGLIIDGKLASQWQAQSTLPRFDLQALYGAFTQARAGNTPA
ncbi:MAG: ABC transporter ATP-binding protein [Hyphomonadaceae bacterium]|jgi:ABC-2 type transport system ATP-binding protein|uniref:ABC transporter ATP-binding protein n=1 Tax=Aquidulcibacter sp. TaxID=2052990 RepID=UPI0022CA6AB6|nr:ABC transporter ATP-binding protein [Aquidulcibacter sp.]MCZ8207259.1 ABC transporter ATP-binding protein [Aquidulcibacter sp.]